MLTTKEALARPVTGYFLAPFLGINDPVSSLPGYLGHFHRLKKAGKLVDSGEFVYIAFSGDDVPATLKEHPLFDGLEKGPGVVVARFRLPSEVIHEVLPHFVQGKYSHFPRELVNRVFPRDPSHRYFGNRLVIDKDDQLREVLESELGLKISPELELWQTYRLDKETFEIEA